MKRSTLGISGLSLCLAVAVSGCGGAAASICGPVVVQAEETKAMLNSIPGVKITLDPEISIEFSPAP